MKRVWILAAGTLVLVPLAWGLRHTQRVEDDTQVEVKPAPPEAAPLCPWREPSADMKSFFPDAARYEVETRILSGFRPELAERLGHAPSSEDNALHLYRVYSDSSPEGVFLVRRVHGEYGAIELVLAIGTDTRIKGWRIQRLREPEAIAAALQDSAWQNAFIGKGANDPWRMGRDIPDVAPEARRSAAAVVEGARSLLILLEASQGVTAPGAAGGHHH